MISHRDKSCFGKKHWASGVTVRIHHLVGGPGPKLTDMQANADVDCGGA